MPAGAAEGDRGLRVLDDAVQFLAHGQLQALVGAPAASGAGQLLVGDDVTFFKAVSVAAEGRGVQQSSSGDACSHTDKRPVRVQAGVTHAGPTPGENRTVALTRTQPHLARTQTSAGSPQQLEASEVHTHTHTQPLQIKVTQNGRLTSARRSESYLTSAVLK